MKTTAFFKLLLFPLVFFISGNCIAQNFNKGKLLYNNSFDNKKKLANWKMEGPGKIEFIDQWMHMYSPNEQGHHVLWCDVDFPENFIAEWEAANLETDAGLCIIFFAAKGINGESIFDTLLPKRTEGTFTDYTKGAINCYHISYYANAKDDPHRETANLRKNKGFNLVQTGEKGIPISSTEIHKIKLIKYEGKLMMYVDERKIIDWTDDGIKLGKILQGGKMGFRQMKWTHFKYRNFKVWECNRN